jgi:hypothetical protein
MKLIFSAQARVSVAQQPAVEGSRAMAPTELAQLEASESTVCGQGDAESPAAFV